MISYDNKTFRTRQNTDNGEVNNETIFTYHQKNDIVWAEYGGGSILKGNLVAVADTEGNLDMRYQHINVDHQLMTGTCKSRPEILDNGLLQLHESWQWTTGDKSTGESVLEEIKP